MIRRMTEAVRRIATIAADQLGSFSRAQAHAAGLTDRQLRNRVAGGLMEQTGPHAFRFPGAARGIAGARARLVALVLDVGGDVVVSGPSAAALHGFDGFVLRAPFHLTIDRARSVSRIGHAVHRTSMLPLIDRSTVGQIAVTSPARTLIDLARSESRERLTIAFDAALRDGLLSEDLLHRRITALRSAGRFGVPKLLSAIEGAEIVRGGHSWLERTFLQLLDRAGLPRPITQQVLTRAGDRLVRVDVRFPGTRLVVELLGYRHHRSAAQMARDSERSNALLLDGFWPLQFTYDQVVEGPEIVATTVAKALAAANIAA
jgi:very-short-patch-repair endonuclease